MRRLLSTVFASKRDKNDSGTTSNAPTKASTVSTASARSPSFLSIRARLKRSHTLTVVPPTSNASTHSSTSSTPALITTPAEHTRSQVSSGSSTGSASFSLMTPEDEHVMLPPGSKRKSWVPWTDQKSTTKAGSDLHETAFGLAVAHRQLGDDDDDESDDGARYLDPPPTSPTSTITPPADNTAGRYLLAITKNALVQSQSLPPSPFLAGSALHSTFPRSCSRHSALRPRLTLEMRMHKMSVMRRVTEPLGRSAKIDLSPFSGRGVPRLLDTPLQDREAACLPPKDSRTTLVSHGVRLWIDRPCFEDRYSVYTPSDPADGVGLACRRVTGSSSAVAALEFSDGIYAMAMSDVDMDLAVTSPIEALRASYTPVAQDTTLAIRDVSSASNSSHPPVTPHSRSIPQLVVPSPLRNQHSTSSMAVSPSPSTTEVHAASQPPPTSFLEKPVEKPVRRGVHFSEDDDKDDVVPLGYVVRMRKRKAEKAKFLREQQELRAFEAERARVEEERLRRDLQRLEWERERHAWEQEQRVAEEERKQRLYAEELAAARKRRESMRIGGLPHSLSSANSLASPGERDNGRDSRRYYRPLYDTSPARERQISDPASMSPASSSPRSSRPPSINRQSSPAVVSPSRPPSAYSSSSEDGKGRQPNKSNRSSMPPLPTRHVPDRAQSYPGWTGPGSNFLMPPMQIIPMQMPPMQMGMQISAASGIPSQYAMDLPLLPPTPPFMLQQMRRRSSPGPGPSPTSRRAPSNNSRESVNLSMRGYSPSNHSRESFYGSSSQGHSVRNASSSRLPDSAGGSHSSSSHRGSHSSLQQQGHRRQRSGDAPAHSSRVDQGTLHRGRTIRPSVSQQLPPQQLPLNPWTGLPTQNGGLPSAYDRSHYRSSTNRRQSTIA